MGKYIQSQENGASIVHLNVGSKHGIKHIPEWRQKMLIRTIITVFIAVSVYVLGYYNAVEDIPTNHQRLISQGYNMAQIDWKEWGK